MLYLKIIISILCIALPIIGFNMVTRAIRKHDTLATLDKDKGYSWGFILLLVGLTMLSVPIHAMRELFFASSPYLADEKIGFVIDYFFPFAILLSIGFYLRSLRKQKPDYTGWV